MPEDEHACVIVWFPGNHVGDDGIGEVIERPMGVTRERRLKFGDGVIEVFTASFEHAIGDQHDGVALGQAYGPCLGAPLGLHAERRAWRRPQRLRCLSGDMDGWRVAGGGE